MNRGSTTVFLVIAGALAGFARPAQAELVTVIYEARAATVVDQPFGVSVPLDTPVHGYFTFDTSTPDSEPEDELDGAYQHDGNAAYLAEFLDTRITGSPTPFYWVDLGPNPAFDTFRIYDGPRAVGFEGGIMSLDGVPDEDVELFLAVSEDVFDDDALINPFPFYEFGFLGDSHTYTLKDDRGTILMQFTSVRTAVCGDAGGGGVAANDALAVLRASVGTLSCYPCLCDVDGNGSITAPDALKTLRFAVAGSPALACSACLGG